MIAFSFACSAHLARGIQSLCTVPAGGSDVAFKEILSQRSLSTPRSEWRLDNDCLQLCVLSALGERNPISVHRPSGRFRCRFQRNSLAEIAEHAKVGMEARQ